MTNETYNRDDRARRHPEEELEKRHTKRSPFEVDYARIVFSEAFRILQGKTQVFTAGRSVRYRTRLTHSIEVAQLARGLSRETPGPFRPDEDLVAAICVSHDIGHPPLGHAGERALNVAAQVAGGFDANAQNLRVVDLLECKHPKGGLNLTRATLDGLVKYAGGKARVFGDDAELLDWIKQGHTGMSLEAELADWADTAAYCVADIEDASRLGVLDTSKLYPIGARICDELCAREICDDGFKSLLDIALTIPKCRDFSNDKQASRELKEWTSATLHFCLLNGCEIRLRDEDADSMRYKYEFYIPRRNRTAARFLRRIAEELVYRSDESRLIEGQLEAKMIRVFKSLQAELGERSVGSDVGREVCDTISCMSDEELLDCLDQLPEVRSSGNESCRG